MSLCRFDTCGTLRTNSTLLGVGHGGGWTKVPGKGGPKSLVLNTRAYWQKNSWKCIGKPTFLSGSNCVSAIKDKLYCLAGVHLSDQQFFRSTLYSHSQRPCQCMAAPAAASLLFPV
eukprot:scaffold2249_cov86-Cylindrotheca_fusiformis.AAC.5